MLTITEDISGFISSTFSIFSTAKIVDFIDIAILSVIIYNLFKIIRETRAGQLAKGIVFLILAYLICYACHLQTLTYLLKLILSNGFLAILITFQPEFRRTLERVGQTSVSKLSFLQEHSDEQKNKWRKTLDVICASCKDLSITHTGALIVIERKTKLGEQINTGTVLEAVPSKELLGNIFYPKTPLHDGAVIIRDGMILAAACFLPKPEREELIAKELGSRHRAAIGMSENSDAIIIVVSEETGKISVASNGYLNRGFNHDSTNALKKYLEKMMFGPSQNSEENKESERKKETNE